MTETMAYDFDATVDRRSTESNKWHKYPADVLPMWVADMDFRSPEPVVRALRERVEHGCFGYGHEEPEFYEVIQDRLLKRYGWRVAREAILTLPGVIPGFNLAARVLADPDLAVQGLAPHTDPAAGHATMAAVTIATEQAFMAGLQTAMWVGAAMSLAGALLALRFPTPASGPKPRHRSGPTISPTEIQSIEDWQAPIPSQPTRSHPW